MTDHTQASEPTEDATTPSYDAEGRRTGEPNPADSLDTRALRRQWVRDPVMGRAHHHGRMIHDLCDALDQARAKAERMRDDAVRNQMEADCKLVCDGCADGVPFAQDIKAESGELWHDDTELDCLVPCEAAAIRATKGEG